MVKIPYFVIFSVEDAVVMLELLHCVLWMKWRSCTEISRDRNDILSFSGALWVISFCSCDWPVSGGVDGGIILGNIHLSNTSWSDKLWIIRCFCLSIHLFFKCLTHPSHALWPASFISCRSTCWSLLWKMGAIFHSASPGPANVLKIHDRRRGTVTVTQ